MVSLDDVTLVVFPPDDKLLIYDRKCESIGISVLTDFADPAIMLQTS